MTWSGIHDPEGQPIYRLGKPRCVPSRPFQLGLPGAILHEELGSCRRREGLPEVREQRSEGVDIPLGQGKEGPQQLGEDGHPML